jgi:hypothetical protein
MEHAPHRKPVLLTRCKLLSATVSQEILGGLDPLVQQELGHEFLGASVVEALAGAVVHLLLDEVEVGAGMNAEVGALGEVLP